MLNTILKTSCKIWVTKNEKWRSEKHLFLFFPLDFLKIINFIDFRLKAELLMFFAFEQSMCLEEIPSKENICSWKLALSFLK